MAVPTDSATVRVPATVANLGAGFDCLAAAVGLYGEVTLTRAPVPDVVVSGPRVPQDPSNLIYRSAAAVASAAGYHGAFVVRAQFPIPVRSGLGSSAAAIVGGAVAASRLLGEPLETGALLDLAVGLEGHPDNVAAALLGGVIVIAQDGAGLRWTRIVPGFPLAVVLAVPDLEIETAAARQVLPRQVSREDAVFNLGHAMLLVAALATGQSERLKGALRDRLHQPHRAPLVPGFDEVVDSAEAAGAYGAVLSGSGPTVAALAAPEVAPAVGEAMVGAFARAGVGSRAIVTAIEPRGALEG